MCKKMRNLDKLRLMPVEDLVPLLVHKAESGYYCSPSGKEYPAYKDAADDCVCWLNADVCMIWRAQARLKVKEKNIKNFWKNDSVGEFFSILYISQVRETFSLLHIAGFGIEKQQQAKLCGRMRALVLVMLHSRTCSHEPPSSGYGMPIFGLADADTLWNVLLAHSGFVCKR